MIPRDPIGWRLLRWIYGGFYLAVGLQAGLVFLGAIPPVEYPNRNSAEFMVAMRETGFMVPLMIFGFISSGACLLFQRTTPLGVVLLAPFVVIIFFTTTLLDARWVWGGLHLAILCVLAWRYRDAFVSLWRYGSDHT